MNVTLDRSTSTEPRVISARDLDEAALLATLDFEQPDHLDPRAARPRTCNFGFTWYCDSDGSGGTCTYGWTVKCDKRLA